MTHHPDHFSQVELLTAQSETVDSLRAQKLKLNFPSPPPPPLLITNVISQFSPFEVKLNTLFTIANVVNLKM